MDVTDTSALSEWCESCDKSSQEVGPLKSAEVILVNLLAGVIMDETDESLPLRLCESCRSLNGDDNLFVTSKEKKLCINRQRRYIRDL